MYSKLHLPIRLEMLVNMSRLSKKHLAHDKPVLSASNPWFIGLKRFFFDSPTHKISGKIDEIGESCRLSGNVSMFALKIPPV